MGSECDLAPFRVLELYSGFRSPGFRIPQAKISWIPETRFTVYIRCWTQTNHVTCSMYVDGLHLANFSVNIQGDRYYRIACHPVGEHVVVAGEERETHLLIAAIYTVNGDFERKIQLNETLKHIFFGTQSPALTVSQQGHITVAFEVKCGGRVTVL